MTITYENAINELGNIRNPYQLLICIYSIYCISNFEFMLMLFMALPTNFRCDWNSTLFSMKIPKEIKNDFNFLLSSFNQSVYDNKCELKLERSNKTVKCKRFIFEHMNSLVGEFDLVCEKKYIRNMLLGAYWVGFVIAVMNGPLSDIFGRRKLIFILSFFLIIILYIFIFSNNVWLLYILQIMKGFFWTAGYLTYNLTMELLNAKSRKIFGMNFFILNFTASSLVAILSYYMPYWRYLQLFSAIYSTPMLFTICIFPESPRWLLAKGQFDEAQNMVNWLCNRNKVNDIDVRSIEKIDTKHYKIWNQIKHKQAVLRIILIFLIWSIVSFMYYGLSYNLNFLSDNPHLSYCLMGFIELPVIIFTLFFLQYFGYKFILYNSSVVASCAIFLVYIFNYQSILRMIIGLIGKFFAAVNFNIVTIFTIETFPTSLRSTGFCLNYIGRISTALIPYALDLKFYHPILPTLIFSILGLLLILLIIPFPETCGKPMHQTVQDLEPITVRNIFDRKITEELVINEQDCEKIKAKKDATNTRDLC